MLMLPSHATASCVAAHEIMCRSVLHVCSAMLQRRAQPGRVLSSCVETSAAATSTPRLHTRSSTHTPISISPPIAISPPQPHHTLLRARLLTCRRRTLAAHPNKHRTAQASRGRRGFAETSLSDWPAACWQGYGDRPLPCLNEPGSGWKNCILVASFSRAGQQQKSK